ncbi:protein outspread-like isoform X2 [Stegodyphus dumicola]|uniref:protein outspread-like isoform X2 n=1 Tax=Stegodyphus dumicola TaxID=202533 RepID=UPI0015B221FC|nr:protein outspread-like isoform X2 [Stegodyphus dumicola]
MQSICRETSDVNNGFGFAAEATRKVCCCGYLFVAPDWDFSLPANRNKRWQRRWFVLYDDGELAYSVDEHPETVPQAVIDMNCVLEVADAENVTGNPFALAVTCPDKVHFIKGMSKDESKKWFEVLSKFPRNTVCGKYKRNATFPCIKSTTVPKLDSASTNISNRRDTVEISNYSKHNGYVNSLNRNNRNQNSSVHFDPDDDVFPTKDTSTCSKVKHLENMQDKKKEETSSVQSETTSTRNSLQEKGNTKSEDIKKYLKQESKDLRKPHSRSDVTKMIPSVIEDKLIVKPDWKKVSLELNNPECIGKSFHNPVYLLMSDVPSGKKIDSYENFFSREKPRYLRRQSSFGKKSDLQNQILWSEEKDEELKNRTIHKSASVPNAVLREDNKIFMNGTSKSLQDKYSTDSKSQSKSTLSQIRGDPDGCNLDSLPSYCTSTAEFVGDQNNESVFLKKGWLVKQDDCKWNKYWFVLRNSALTFYSDPIAEDAGILDGVVDLRKVKSVSEVQSSSGHTFCVLMKDFSKLYLSAVTAKIRNNWIRAILQAANLKSISCDDNTPKKKQDVDLKSIDIPKENTSNLIFPDSSVSSLDSEKSCSSSSSKTIVEDEYPDNRGPKSMALPPSPPLARTAISRVKERAKTRSNSRTRCSRFRSTEINESDHNYLADSDDGTTDHSSSSLPNSAVVNTKEKRNSKENSSKYSEEKSRPERRRSFRLSNLDNLSLHDGRKKVIDIKDKLEDSSWTIWLDISKFCKEVESKLDDIEEKSPKNGPHLSGDQKKEISNLVTSLGRVEDRLHKVQNELEKAKVTLLINNKDNDLGLSLNKAIACHSLKQEVSKLSGTSNQNVLIAQQLNKVREENKRLKVELKTAQASSDDFELQCISLKQASDQADKLHQSQMELMVARVDDLTSKLLASEKNVRQLRQRVMKLEQRQERRRSSLKGKEALSLSKEYESKLSELEQKIDAVEGVLKNSDCISVDICKDKEEINRESQSLLMRLHNLDKKVKDVAETVSSPPEEVKLKQDDLPKPKIRLQVNLNENTPQDTNEDWNSLSLSASMTDLSNADKDEICSDDPLSLTFNDCLESLGHKVSSLISWLKTTLQLLYAQGNVTSFHSSKMDFISCEAAEELGKLVQALDHVTGKMDDPSVIPQDITCIVSRLLYNIILLQEVTNVIFKMNDFEKYKTAVLVQHLNRVKQAVIGIEQYIQQKSNPVHNSVQKTSLCNIVACLLFYRSSCKEIMDVSDIKDLFEDVDSQRKKVCTVLTEFKGKFMERFCTTILELSEDSMNDKISPKSTDQKTDLRPLGQKQFLSHISHIISQVSQSFIAHISKSLNEVYFLCSSFQYSEKWTEYICKLLQQELSLLSSEIKSICIKNLENSFFSSSKCGVLVEYMHCSISELAQLVSIITVIDGTVILIKDAIYSDSDVSKNIIQNNFSGDKEALNTFHENLQQRSMSIMSNLPLYRFPNAFFSLCNPNELNVAHRSVSSLLCFKQKWKQAIENEMKEHHLQLEKLTAKISELQAEQKRRLEEGCKSCIELRQEVSYLQAELDESRTLARSGTLCEKCRNLKLEIQHLMEQHEKDLALVEKFEEQELLWKDHVQNIMQEKEKQFSEEKWKLEKELQSAQKNLQKIENKYDEEIRNLQHMYEQKLQQKHENIREDLIKLRYSSEIEQLKSLCEKGLSAMDASHKKIISELEMRHQKELEDLMAEREKALADEAHATAIALEAVRKAHSEELQRQIQKFKDEFVLKMNKRFETEAFKKCYESDIASVKYEILSMTEKYSVKCLENATLHEKLEVMTQQLKSTTTQVVELLAKNQQLQARLTSGAAQKQEELL